MINTGFSLRKSELMTKPMNNTMLSLKNSRLILDYAGSFNQVNSLVPVDFMVSNKELMASPELMINTFHKDNEFNSLISTGFIVNSLVPMDFRQSSVQLNHMEVKK